MSSKTVDEPVVKMKFDNADFEKKVQTTMNTIDALTNKLNKTDQTEAFRNVSKGISNLDFSPIVTSLETISNRFSVMGIAGMTVISNLTNSAMNMLGNIGNKIKGLIFTGGFNRASNIENAKFQLEGLKIAYDDVSDAIDYAVNNTAYSLDAAAQAAAQLSTAGVDYKKVVMTHEADNKELTSMSMALRAISGVAAQTQTDFSMVSRYFQDVATQGKLAGAQISYMTQVLNLPVKQNLVEGLNAIADGSFEASEAVKKNVDAITKKGKVSTESIDDIIKKGMIDFDTFSTIMFDKYADHAIKANDTLSGVTANIRSAWAKIGADFLEPIIRNQGELVKMLEKFRLKINEIRSVLKPISAVLSNNINVILEKIGNKIESINIKDAFNFDTKNLQLFILSIKNLFSSISTYFTPIKEVFSEIFSAPSNKSIHTMLFNFNEFVKSLKASESDTEKIKSIFKGFFAILNIGKQAFQGLLIPIKTFLSFFKNIPGNVFDASASIGDWLVALSKSAEESGIFLEMGNKISETLIKVKDKIKEFSDFIVKKFTELKNYISNNTAIQAFINSLKNSFASLSVDGSLFTNFINIFKGNTSVLEKAGKVLSMIFDGVFTILSKTIPFIVNTVKNITSVFKDFFGSLENFMNIGGIDANKAVNNSIIMIIFINLKKMVDGLKSMNPVSMLSNISGALLNFTNSLKKLSKALAASIDMDAIHKMAEAVLILAISMAILSTLDVDKLAETVGVVILLMQQLFGMLKTIIGFKTDKLSTIIKDIMSAAKIDMIAGVVVKIAASVLILAIAMKVISGIDIGTMINASGVISGFLWEMVGVTAVLAQVDTSKMNSSLKSIKSIAVAVLILAAAAKIFGSMSWEDLGKAGAAITVLVNELTGAVLLLGTTNLDNKKIKSFGKAFLEIAVSMIIFGAAAKIFGSMNWEDLGKAGAAMTVIIAAITGMVVVIDKFTKYKTDMAKIGFGIIEIAVAMIIFASASKSFAEMNWEDLGKAGAAIGVILSVITGMMLLLGNWGGNAGKMLAIGAAMIMIAAGIKILGSSVKTLGEMDTENLIDGLAAVISLLAVLAIFSMVCNPGSLLAISASLILFGVGLMGLTAQLLVLGSVDNDKILGGIIKLVAVLATLGIMAAVLQPVAGTMVVVAAAMLLMGAACIVLGMGLIVLSAGIAVVSATINVFLQALEAILLGVLDMLKTAIPEIVDVLINLLVSLIESLVPAIPKIVGLLLDLIIETLIQLKEKLPTVIKIAIEMLLDFFVAIGEAFQDVDVDALVDAMKALGILGAVFAELAVVGVLALAGTIGAALIAGALAVCTLLFNAIAGMNLSETLPLMDQFSQILMKFGAAIALFATFGAIGSLAAVGALLPVVTALVAILTVLGGLSAIPGFDWLITEGGEMLSKIGGIIGNFLGTIIANFAAAALSTLPQIAMTLSQFMIGLTPFIVGAKMIDESCLDSIGILVKTITLMCGAEIIKGITDFLTGGDSLAKFGAQLAELGPYMMQYYNSIRGMDGSLVESSANAAMTLVEFAKAIPNEGGLVSKITGDNSIQDFAKELVLFGPSLMAYALSVKGLNADDVTNSTNAAMAITEFAKTIPNEGGLVAKITGDNSISAFAKELVLFGPSLMAYAVSVKGLDADVVTNSTKAAEAISAMAKGLPNSDGLVSWFTGDNTLSKFALELYSFAPSFKYYSDKMKDVNPDVVTSSTNAAKSIAELANNLPNSGGLASIFSGDNTLSDFGTELKEFGELFVEYYNSTSSIDGGKMYTLSKAIVSLTDVLPILTVNNPSLLNDFVDGLLRLSELDIDTITGLFNESQTPLSESLTTFFETIKTLWEDHKETIENIVKEIIENINVYLNGEGTNILINTINSMCNKMTTGIRLQRQSFYSAGQYITMGFIGGIKSKAEEAAQAAADLAKATYDAAMTAIDANSPSKLFKKVGGYVGAGFVIGIEDYYDRVYQAGAGLADSSINGTTDFMSGIEDIMSDTDDFNPVIRPTLDLSNVMSGAKQVGAIFNNSKLSASVDGSQNGGKSDASNNVTYNQYNYSPKALSRIDIYRQTRNQLSMSKG